MNFLQRAVANVESRLDQVLAADGTTQGGIAVPIGDPSLTGGFTHSAPATTIQTPVREASPTPEPAVSRKDARSPPPISTSSTPTPSSGRMTMQERLAAAMAKSAAARSASPAVGGSERTASPAPTGTPTTTVIKSDAKGEEAESDSKPAQKTESGTANDDEKDDSKDDATVGTTELKEPTIANVDSKTANGIVDAPEETRISTRVASPRPSVDIPRRSIDSQPRASLETRPPIVTATPLPATSTETPVTASAEAIEPVLTGEDLLLLVTQLREDLAICEARRAEESAASSERIDSLEEKLKYVSKESADEARKRIQTGGASALEKELAKRDERIALLLEEGERLSKTELKHMNNIKRLRAKTQEEEKATAEAKRKQERAEREAADLKEKTKRAVEAEKRANEKVRALGKMEVDYESLKRERDILQISTSDLKLQLSKAVTRADEAESKVQTEALEAERKLTADLKDRLEKLQNDSMADKERWKSEVWTLQSKIERDGDRSKAVELELKNEISMLETKLEVMRARAEEASSGNSENTHAKLLRQVETLQSQYAVASENWHGIEASLMSRLTSVEKERDELSRKEGDVRKKAREVNQKLRRLESDLESANSKIQDLESSLNTQLLLCEDLRKQISLHEESKTQLDKRIEEERAGWQKEIKELRDSLTTATEEIALARPKSRSNSAMEVDAAIRPISPNPRGRKPSIGSDMNVPFASKRPLNRTDSREVVNDLQAYRRPTLTSTGGPYTSSHASTPRLDSVSGFSGPSSRQNSMFGNFGGIGMGISTPSLTPGMTVGDVDNESMFEGNGIMSPSSHEGRNGGLGGSAHIGDMLSVSTVAAGPSVQLVERMSASVRRLESEMATSREELSRLTAQRDEARAEVVSLMTEVDEKRKWESRVETLESELKEKETVYEATLVMLGEKSEEVEELRNDVADLKQMYRDLIISQTKT